MLSISLKGLFSRLVMAALFGNFPLPITQYLHLDDTAVENKGFTVLLSSIQ